MLKPGARSHHEKWTMATSVCGQMPRTVTNEHSVGVSACFFINSSASSTTLSQMVHKIFNKSFRKLQTNTETFLAIDL